jgi:hypothetical protein
MLILLAMLSRLRMREIASAQVQSRVIVKNMSNPVRTDCSATRFFCSIKSFL